MNIKLYRQRKKAPNAEGRIVFQGEDTHPYADNELIIVADGLGGRGGFPHNAFDKRILNKEQIYDVMFAPIFEREIDGELREFIVNNFEELFITEEYYDAEEIEYTERYDPKERRMVKVGKPYTPYIRCSGYFASRIVTAIALYEMKYNPAFKRETVFENLSAMEKTDADAYAMELGATLRDCIAEKLRAVADNVGFTIEMDTTNKGVYLLPTTLTLTLYDEGEDEVRALYLWAGDTRGYIWDEVNGMGQVTEDHERDETMTNLITLSKPFEIEGRFASFKKPCVLFNTSDGVYKPPAFASPIDQEGLLLRTFEHFASEEDAIKYLVDAYNHISPDDSSTLSLVPFGYPDYESLRAAMIRRLEIIKEKYLTRLPDLFDRDYPGDLAKLDSTLMNMDGVKDELIKVDAIFEIVRSEMLMRGYAPYVAAKREAGMAIAPLDERIAAAKNAIIEAVKDNWIARYRLRRCTPAANKRLGDDECSPCEQMKRLIEKRKEIVASHNQKLKEIDLANGFMLHTNNIIKVVAQSYNVSKAIDEDTYAEYDEAKEYILSTLELIDNMRARTFKSVAEYDEVCDSIDALTERCVNEDREEFEAYINEILTESGFNAFKIKNAGLYESIAPLFDEYFAAKAERDACAAPEADEYVLAYWNESGRLLGLIWNQHRDLIPEEVYERLLASDPEKLEERRMLVNGVKTREIIYKEYEETYYRNYMESRL